MKRRSFTLIFSLAMLFLISLFINLSVFAAIEVKENGVVKGIINSINATGDVTVAVSGSVATFDVTSEGGFVNEIVTDTEKTVTAADTGKRFIFTTNTGGPDNQVLVHLPAAATGLTYSFVDGGAGARMVIEPQAGDLIVYLGGTMVAGDRLQSAGDSGNTVTFVGGSGVWYVVNTGDAAWTDVN